MKCPLCGDNSYEDGDLMWHLHQSHQLFEWGGGLHCPCGEIIGNISTPASGDLDNMAKHFRERGGIKKQTLEVVVLRALQTGGGE